jgi:glycosyltransferase involved in cell wall biosynthesis
MTDRCKYAAISVVVPTRNEAANVHLLLERIAAAVSPLGEPWEVVFVDDSDDETPAEIEIAGLRYPVRLCHRPPEHRSGGLSGAVLEGFEAASGEVLVVMDGDLQHPPETLPALIDPVSRGIADLVVASRYTGSGSTAGLDGPVRRVVSNWSRGVTRAVVARSQTVSDPLSGFFALRRSVVDGVELRPYGFKILLEIIARGRWSRLQEVPFVFADRMAGESKAGVSEGFRFLRHLTRLVRPASSVAEPLAVPTATAG